jgi:hypothetical protein
MTFSYTLGNGILDLSQGLCRSFIFQAPEYFVKAGRREGPQGPQQYATRDLFDGKFRARFPVSGSSDGLGQDYLSFRRELGFFHLLGLTTLRKTKVR